MIKYRLDSGEHKRGDNRETEHGPSGLVKVGDLEAHAYVPGQMPHSVKGVEHDGPGQGKLGGKDERGADLHLVHVVQPHREGT